MKQRSLILTMALGLMAGLFACQDQSVVAPDDLQPQFAKGGKKPPKDPPTDGSTLALEGVFSGNATEGVSWSYKKGVFKGNASQGSITVTTSLVMPEGVEAYRKECKVKPADPAGNGDALIDALVEGLVGISAVLRVDMAKAGMGEGEEGDESAVNRITSYVGDETVRYFWIGPWGELADGNTIDATVSNFVDGAETITYTLTGGAVGVRDPGSPSRVVQIACPNSGEVRVTITK